MSRHAANVSSTVICPAHPSTPGLTPGVANVLVRSSAAVGLGDSTACDGAPNPLLTGNPTVRVGGRPIGRELDMLLHGAIVAPIPDSARKVMVGVPAMTPTNELVHLPAPCKWLRENMDDADAMRPLPQNALNRYRRPYEMKPQPDGSYVVEVGDKKIPIKVEGSAPAGKLLPTPAQVAAALAVAPPDMLDGVDSIVISPTAVDAPAFYSKGTITFGPRDPNIVIPGGSRPRTQGDLDWQTLHELSHGYDHKYLGTKEESEWREAAHADKKFPSRYARESYLNSSGKLTEDFAESVVMYALVRGTPCETPARAMFPHRFQLLDRKFGLDFS